MAIDAKLVKELRQESGLPMMDCKKALQETNGDVEAAKEVLRKKGKKIMAKKAERTTNEGKIGGFVAASGKSGVLFALCCETEPVASCEDFTTFYNELLDTLQKSDPLPASLDEVRALSMADGKSVQEHLEQLIGKIRENIQLRDYVKLEGDAVFQYIHFNYRHGSLIQIAGVDPSDATLQELGKDMCMHVVFAKPAYLSKDDVPADIVGKEREILAATLENDPKMAKKPDQIKSKIVEGQIGRFFSEQCLLEQPFIKDDKSSVSKYLNKQAKGAELQKFSYMGLA